MGSYVYFFMSTSLIPVKFICMVIFVNFSLNKGNPELSSIHAMGCFANTKEISHITTKWGVRKTYMGSYVYFFVSTSLIPVKFICIVIFANTNEISHMTSKWGVRTTYVGSHVHIFICSTLIQVKFIYKLNSHKFFTQ